MGNYWTSTIFHKNNLSTQSLSVYNPIRYLLPSTYNRRKPAKISKFDAQTLEYKLYNYKQKITTKEHIDPLEMMIQKMLLTQSLMKEHRKRTTIGVLLRIWLKRAVTKIGEFIRNNNITCEDHDIDEDVLDKEEDNGNDIIEEKKSLEKQD